MDPFVFAAVLFAAACHGKRSRPAGTALRETGVLSGALIAVIFLGRAVASRAPRRRRRDRDRPGADPPLLML